MATADVGGASGAGRNSRSDLISMITQLAPSLFGKGTETITSSEGKNITPEQLKALMSNMSASSSGLASVLMPQRQAGLYNSPVNTLLAQQLKTQIAGKAAELGTPTVKTQTSKQAANPGVSKVAKGLGLLQGASMLKKGYDEYGSDVKKLFESIFGPEAKSFTDSIGKLSWDNMSGDLAPIAGYSDGMNAGLTLENMSNSVMGLGGNSAFTNGAADADAWLASLGDAGSSADWSSIFSPSSFDFSAGMPDVGSFTDSVPYLNIATNAMDGEWGWNDTGAVVGSYFGPIGSMVGSAIGEPVGDVIEGVGGALSDAVSGIGDAVSGVFGGGGGSVICTELHRQGLISTELYRKDALAGMRMAPEVIIGYHSFGKPIAAAMAKSPLVTSLVAPVAIRWAKHVAGDSNITGKLLMTFLVPVCAMLGKLIMSARKQPVLA